MTKDSRLYAVVTYLGLILFPGLGTIFFILNHIWHLPEGIDILGLIITFEFFIGILWHFSRTKYDGVIDIIETQEKKTFTMILNGDPDDIEKQDTVVFKIHAVS